MTTTKTEDIRLVNNPKELTGLLEAIFNEPTEPLHRLVLADFYQEQDISREDFLLINNLREDGYFTLGPLMMERKHTYPDGTIFTERKLSETWILAYRTRKKTGIKVVSLPLGEFDREARESLPYCQGIDPSTETTVHQQHHRSREVAAKPGHFPKWYCHNCYSQLCDVRAKALRKLKKAEERKKQGWPPTKSLKQ